MGDFNTVGGISSQGVAGAASAAKGYSGYMSYASQGSYQKGISDVNAQLLAMQSADTERRGQLAAGNQLVSGNQIAGRQRAVFGASGVDVNSGSAASAIAGTKAMSELDAITIENNAHLAAIGINMEQINQQASGRFAQIAGQNNAVQAGISGGMGLVQRGLQAGAIADRYKLTVPVTPSVGLNGANDSPGSDLSANYEPL